MAGMAGSNGTTLSAPKPPPQGRVTVRDARPTQEYLRASAWSAAQGMLRAVGPYITDDLTRSFSGVYEQMQHAPKVFACLSTISLSVVQDGLSLRPAVDDKDDPDYEESKRHLKDGERYLSALPFSIEDRLREMMAGALALGHKVAEKVYRPAGTGKEERFEPEGLTTKPRSAYSFALDDFNRLVGLAPRMSGPGAYGGYAGSGPFDPKQEPPVPRSKFVVFTHAPQDGSPLGTSLLRAAYTPWWHFMQASGEFLKFLALCAVPIMVGEMPAGAGGVQAPSDDAGNPGEAPEAQVQAFLNKMITLHGGSAIALPPGWKINWVQAGEHGSAFLAAFQFFNTEMEQAITSQNLATSEAKHGTRAQAGVHQDTLELRPAHLRRVLERDLHWQWTREWVSINHGPRAARLAPWPSMTSVPKQDRATLIAAYVPAGYQLAPEQLPAVDEELGLPPRNPPQPGAPGQNPPPGGGAPPGPGAPPAAGPQPAQPAGDFLAGLDAGFAFDESQHPRGQPENKGQFGPGGGGAPPAPAAQPAQAPAPAPPAPEADVRTAHERVHGAWQARQQGRDARRDGLADAESALASGLDAPQKALSDAVLSAAAGDEVKAALAAYSAAEHGALLAPLARGLPEAAQAKVGRELARWAPKVERKAGALAEAAGKHALAKAVLAEVEAAEPKEPGQNAPGYGAAGPEPEAGKGEFAYPPEGSPNYDVEVERLDAAWEKAHDKWSAEDDAGQERYQKDYDRWEAAHTRWEGQAEKAQEKLDARDEALVEARSALDEVLDARHEALGELAYGLVTKATEALDHEDDADPEPEAPEDAGFAFNALFAGLSPADLDAEGGYAAFAKAAQQRQVGEVWQGPSGRWFTRRESDGRTVPAKAPGGAQAAPAEGARSAPAQAAKPTVEALAADLKALNRADLTPEKVKHYADTLAGMSDKDLNALKAALGWGGRGGIVERAKSKGLAGKMLARATQEETEGAKAGKPAPAPAASAPPAAPGAPAPAPAGPAEVPGGDPHANEGTRAALAASDAAARSGSAADHRRAAALHDRAAGRHEAAGTDAVHRATMAGGKVFPRTRAGDERRRAQQAAWGAAVAKADEHQASSLAHDAAAERHRAAARAAKGPAGGAPAGKPDGTREGALAFLGTLPKVSDEDKARHDLKMNRDYVEPPQGVEPLPWKGESQNRLAQRVRTGEYPSKEVEVDPNALVFVQGGGALADRMEDFVRQGPPSGALHKVDRLAAGAVAIRGEDGRVYLLEGNHRALWAMAYGEKVKLHVADEPPGLERRGKGGAS
jgi:hypothetical protein